MDRMLKMKDHENAELRSQVQSLSANQRNIERDFLKHLNRTAPQLVFPPNMFYGGNITNDLLRRSRTEIGDRYRFAQLLAKLESGKCINAAVLGGSISIGTNLNRSGSPSDVELIHYDKHKELEEHGGSEKIWFEHLEDWLNAAFPCDGTHKFTNKARAATGAKYALDHFYDLFISDNTQYDLVLAEWSVNDPREEKTMADTEQLIRAVLKLPSEPMIMYVEMSWDHRGKPPFWVNAAHWHSKILFYYQIPTVSTFNTMFPIHLYRHVPFNAMFLDNHHNNHDGHKLTAVFIAYAIYEEQCQSVADPLQNMTDHGLPPIWLANPNDNRATQKPLESMLFMNPDFNMSSMDAHITGDWSHFAETAKKKWGLIANTQNSTLSIRIAVTNSVTIGYLKSYENIGKAAMWIDDEEIVDSGLDCEHLQKERIAERLMLGIESIAADGSEYVVLNGLWSTDSSQPFSRSIGIRDVNSSTKWVHFCLPQDQKFKLLSLTSY